MAIIFGSQLVSNIGISDVRSGINAMLLIFISEESGFCRCIGQRSGWIFQHLSIICRVALVKQIRYHIEKYDIEVHDICHLLLG